MAIVTRSRRRSSACSRATRNALFVAASHTVEAATSHQLEHRDARGVGGEPPWLRPGTWRYERARALIAARDERAARDKKTRWIDRPAPGRSQLGYGGYRLSPMSNREFVWSIVGLALVIGAVLLVIVVANPY